MATLPCGCRHELWSGVTPSPACDLHRIPIGGWRSVSMPAIQNIPTRTARSADPATGTTFEGDLALAEAKLTHRARQALANDEIAEHDLLQEAIELLHEARRTVDRSLAARSREG